MWGAVGGGVGGGNLALRESGLVSDPVIGHNWPW